MRDPVFMLIPVGEDTDFPVTLVLLSPEPEILHAKLRRLEQDELRIEVPGGTPAPALGTRLIVNAAERTKLTGRLLAAEGTVWSVSRDRMHATDDRAAPRVRSRIRLRWRHAVEPFEAWLAGAEDPAPYTSFSGGGDLSLSGVRFDLGDAPTTHLPEFGDKLYIELLVAGGAHRALGIVRRVEPAPNLSVAIEFLEVPESTFDALSEFTLDHL